MNIQEYVEAQKAYRKETVRLHPNEFDASSVKVGDTISTVHGDGIVASIDLLYSRPRPAVQHFVPPVSFDGKRLLSETPAYSYPEWRPIKRGNPDVADN